MSNHQRPRRRLPGRTPNCPPAGCPSSIPSPPVALRHSCLRPPVRHLQVERIHELHQLAPPTTSRIVRLFAMRDQSLPSPQSSLQRARLNDRWRSRVQTAAKTTIARTPPILNRPVSSVLVEPILHDSASTLTIAPRLNSRRRHLSERPRTARVFLLAIPATDPTDGRPCRGEMRAAERARERGPVPAALRPRADDTPSCQAA